jgi:hypothetical protein
MRNTPRMRLCQCRCRLPSRLGRKHEQRAPPGSRPAAEVVSTMATIAGLLEERVSLQVNSVHRIFLAGYISKLRSAGMLVRFLLDRGFQIPSPALLGRIGSGYVRAIEQFVQRHRIPVVHVKRGVQGAHRAALGDVGLPIVKASARRSAPLQSARCPPRRLRERRGLSRVARPSDFQPERQEGSNLRPFGSVELRRPVQGRRCRGNGRKNRGVPGSSQGLGIHIYLSI